MPKTGANQSLPSSLEEDEEHVLAFGEVATRLGQSVDYRVGDDILIHVKTRADRQCFVINDYVGGQWRSEYALDFPAGGAPHRIALRFGSEGIRAAVPGSEPILFRSVNLVGLRPEIRIPRSITLDRARPARKGEEPEERPDQAPHNLEAAIISEFLREVRDAAAPGPGDEPAPPPLPNPGPNPGPDLVGPDPGPDTPPAPPPVDGYIDFHAEFTASAVWLFGGWTRRRWPDSATTLALLFESGEAASVPQVMWNERPDLDGAGTGFVLTVPAEAAARLREEPLAGLRVEAGGETVHLTASRDLVRPNDTQIVQWMRDILGRASGGAVEAIRAIATRPAYTGIDTIGGLPVPFHLEVDEVISVGSMGVFVLGWMLDPNEAVASIRLRAGPAASPCLREHWLPVERPDVRDAFASRYDLPDARCGFLAFGAIDAPDGRGLHVEIVLHTGEIAFKPLPRSFRSGASAIRRVLSGIHLTRDEIADAFDRVLGPPLVALSRERLAKPMAVTEFLFGTPPEAPRCSLVVPLYGRLDFMAYQLALFSESGMPADELIYVLDEPAKKAALLDTAQSLHARYGIPLRIVLPAENRGFGPASNLGLRHARGRHVLFLNSDVFPRDPQWLDRMVESLESDPGIGIVGGTLLFADGSVQHAGMDYEPLPQFAGWPFPTHPGKGMRPARAATRLQDTPGVTGACMLLRRDLAMELGGFDESYVIGDFEDADLCHRIAARGLRCVVDREAVLYHLERQSQGDQSKSWRLYLTLLNAWTHARRWAGPGGPLAPLTPPRRIAHESPPATHAGPHTGPHTGPGAEPGDRATVLASQREHA